MKIQWLFFSVVGFVLWCGACAPAPVEMRQTPAELQQGVVLIEAPTVVGDASEFGEQAGVSARVQRDLRTRLQAQGVRVTDDPTVEHHAVIRTLITLNEVPDAMAEGHEEEAGDAKRMKIEVDLIDGSEFLSSGDSGSHWVWRDLETNHGGYRSSNYIADLAVNDLFKRGVARGIGGASTASFVPEESKPDPSDASSHSFATATPQRQSYALIIGVEEYRDLPAPTGARGDAEKFAELVKLSMGLPEQNIRVLTDQNATRGDILSELRWLDNNVPAGGRIYLYFSGHGSPDPSEGTSFLLPYEATPESMEDTGLELSMVMDRLEATSAREIIAFVDACFSGTGGRSVLPEGIRPLVPVQDTKPKSRIAIFSASQATEISGNRAGEDIGLFTHYLVEGLGLGRADGDGDGQISLAELEAYVAPRVAREARQASREQNPSLFVSEDLGLASDLVVTWGIAAE